MPKPTDPDALLLKMPSLRAVKAFVAATMDGPALTRLKTAAVGTAAQPRRQPGMLVLGRGQLPER